MSEITSGSTPTKVKDVIMPNNPPKPGPKLSEQPGFADLPAHDRDRILRAEAKRERKRARSAKVNKVKPEQKE